MTQPIPPRGFLQERERDTDRVMYYFVHFFRKGEGEKGENLPRAARGRGGTKKGLPNYTL